MSLGRHVFGAAALASGVITLVWHGGPVLIYVAAAAQIVGGVAIQFRQTAKMGAVVLAATYLVFAVRCVPGIISTPKIYNSWENFFEQFSLATGVAIVYACLSSAWTPEALGRAGRSLVGVCAASFTIEQAVYLGATAALVPKWIPPSQMFWAITTTGLFAIAVLALLINRGALLASRLLTAMLVLFGLLVWLPLLFSDPHTFATWSETIETFAIAGVVWILADLLGN